MSEYTRRRFVRQSAGAAAGLTAVGALTASQAAARATAKETEPIVAYVKNPSTGEITVLSGEHEVTVHDHALAARIARASH